MKKRKRIVKKKIAKEMVKRIGDSLIQDAEGIGGRCNSFGIFSSTTKLYLPLYPN